MPANALDLINQSTQQIQHTIRRVAERNAELPADHAERDALTILFQMASAYESNLHTLYQKITEGEI